MRFDNLGTAWREENAEAAAQMNRDALIARVSRRVERFRSRIVWRDWRETLVAAAVMPVFMLKAWSTNNPTLERVGSAVIVVGLLFIIYRLHAVRLSRPKVDEDAPVREFYRAELARIEDQIKLLRSVLGWYVAPIFAGVAMSFVGQLGLTTTGLASLAFLAAIAWFLHAINQHAVRRELVPIRDEIVELLEQLAPSVESDS
ncbi:MAG: hypothetical protein AAF266_14920 [Planctomycetota bacterium]